MPAEPPRRPPRHYLRAEDRRRQLLAAAARLAGRGGLAQLTMVGVAHEAGVSRQLLYEHFADLPTLTIALLVDRFGELDGAIERHIASAASEPLDAALAAAGMLLDLPADDRRILRALHVYASTPEHELRELGTRLRTRTIDRWAALLRTGDEPGARAMVWALTAAAFGLGDLLDAGTITTTQALEQMAVLIGAAIPRLRRQKA